MGERQGESTAAICITQLVEPVRPDDSECCGSGCNPCILDLYNQELIISRRTVSVNHQISQLNCCTYTDFELLEIIPQTSNTSIYRFKLPSGQLLGHKAGQHLIIRERFNVMQIDNLEEVKRPVDNLEEVERPLDNLEQVERPVDNLEVVERLVDNLEKRERLVDNLVEEERTVDDNLEKGDRPVDILEEEERPVDKLEEEEKPVEDIIEERLVNNLLEMKMPLDNLTIPVDSLKEDQRFNEKDGKENEPVDILNKSFQPFQKIIDSNVLLAALDYSVVGLKSSSENTGMVARSLCRQYSILSQPSADGHFDLLIKLYEGGRMSELIRGWRPGKQISMRGPLGSFRHMPGSYPRLLLCCQGTGIVPFIPIIRELLEDECDTTIVRMMYSVQSTEDILIPETLSELSEFWNFSIKIFSSKETGGYRLLGPNKEIIHSKLTYLHLQSEYSDGTYCLLCGSKEFMNTVQSWLLSFNVKLENIFRF